MSDARRAALLAGILSGFLAGCAPRRVAPLDIDSHDEQLLGQRLVSTILAAETVIADDEVDTAIADLAGTCGSPSVSWHVVRSETPLLLDLPGGRVILSTGLVASARDDAHLAALLAHGAAHAGRRHATLRLLRTHGSAKLGAMARGESDAAFSALAANAAAGGVLLRHGLATEKEANDVVIGAGCESGAVTTAIELAGERGLAAKRLENEHAQAHAAAGSSLEPGASERLARLRQRLGLPS